MSHKPPSVSRWVLLLGGEAVLLVDWSWVRLCDLLRWSWRMPPVWVFPTRDRAARARRSFGAAVRPAMAIVPVE